MPMSDQSTFGLGLRTLPRRRGDGIEHVTSQRPLRRVLDFVGHSIDEVCNDPIVKNKVFGYYKLHRQIERSIEITELERWWNGD